MVFPLAEQLMDYVANNTQQAISDLQVVADKVDDIVDTIRRELHQLDPDAFKHGAHIDPPAFGPVRQGPLLAVHYTRAHEVVTDTLVGVQADLVNFQHACKRAQHDLIEADQHTADRLKWLQRAVTALTKGSVSDQGDADHQAAQRAHADDVPAGL